MKSINFTEKELEFLRKQYQDELESAQQYVNQVSEILEKLGAPSTEIIKESAEQEPKVAKRRGRKPKVKIIETKEPKKRGPKPKPVMVEPKVPKKRGRPFKAVVVPAVSTSSVTPVKEPKKRGRKPRITSVTKSESKILPTPAVKEEKKIVAKKSTSKRKRKWRGIVLTPMSKPFKLKEPKEEPVEEPDSDIESTVPPATEAIISPIEEPKE